MKNIFKLPILLILISALLTQCAQLAIEAAAYVAQKEYLYLIAGLDESEENTDSLIIVSYSPEKHSAAVVQLPRDTYINLNNTAKKINSIYSSGLHSGEPSEKAMKRTTEFIGEQLGLSFDGFILITISGFLKIIDAIGGVRVNMPEDFIICDSSGAPILTLMAGENLLSGKEALLLVRHRRSYITGDIGRMDAQKIFINGFFETVTKYISYDEIFRIMPIIMRQIVTDVSIPETLALVLAHSSKFRDVNTVYLSMPGKSVCYKDLWYYVLNRDASIRVIDKYFGAEKSSFDVNRIFTDASAKEISDIYNEKNIGWREYTSDIVSEIAIPRR